MKTRKMLNTDWNAVATIYADGISTGYATFEKNIPTFENWDKTHLPICRIVVIQNSSIVGWAALSPVSSRCVYGGVAEVSVYVASLSTRKGVGQMLMNRLIQESEKEGIWTLQSGIFPENMGSISLHEKVGFRYIGKRDRIGQLDGVWKDNLLFERRSKIVGV